VRFRLGFRNRYIAPNNTGNSISIIGIPNFIQSTNAISKAFAAIAFGGEPTIVPKPPRLAEYAIPSSTNTNVPRSSLLSTCVKIPRASGSIIAVVAVFEIHIDKNAVTPKINSTAVLSLPPDNERIFSAIFLSSFCTCNAAAKAKPPKKR
jgi:hypothetical protein